MNDPFEDPDFIKWADTVIEELIPMIRDSAMNLTILPKDPKVADIKLAVELGITMLMDKPLVLMVLPGRQVPDRLVRAADLIVECDMESEASINNAKEAIQRFMEKINADEGATTETDS